MAYIGKQPVVGNFQVCDAISVVNGQAAYTMQVGSTNVEPENANHMLVSLNGILQKPGSSFTISGATITFASNLATGDVIDFIILLGDTLNVGTPSDDSVGAAQIKNDLISGTTALSSAPDDTDEFLVSDAGTLKRIDYSLIKGSSDRIKLGSSDISDASSVTFDVFTDDYRSYEVIFDNVVQSDARYIRMRPRNSSGTISSGMYSVVQSYEDAGGSQARDDTHLANSDHFRLHNGNGPRNSSSASIIEPYGQLLHMTIGDVRTSGEPFVWSLHGFNFDYDGNRNGTVTAAGTTQSNFDVYTGVEFAPNGSGTFVSGKITIYGNK